MLRSMVGDRGEARRVQRAHYIYATQFHFLFVAGLCGAVVLAVGPGTAVVEGEMRSMGITPPAVTALALSTPGRVALGLVAVAAFGLITAAALARPGTRRAAVLHTTGAVLGFTVLTLATFAYVLAPLCALARGS